MPDYVIPFLRRNPLHVAQVEVHSPPDATITPLPIEVRKPNGLLAQEGVLVGNGGMQSSAELAGDLYALSDCGAVHFSASDAQWVVLVEGGGDGTALREPIPSAAEVAGISFVVEETDAEEPFAVLANVGKSELFVFVSDRQGPFIPPRGAARIQIPKPGGPLSVTVENGEAVLSYRGRIVMPID